MTCCVLKSNRTIYVCGGCRSSFVENMANDSVVKTVEKLELDKNGDPVGEWTQVKPMKEKRLGAAAVAFGNRYSSFCINCRLFKIFGASKLEQ